MSINYDCFQTAIGLAPAECPCIDGFEEDYSISDSGLYVSNLEGMSLRGLDSAGGCEDLWAKMVMARDQAIKAFKMDVSMGDFVEPSRRPFTGDIGRTLALGAKKVSSMAPASQYYGMRLYSDIRGGVFTLRGVTIMADMAEAMNLCVYDEYDLLYIHPVSSLGAGRPKKNTVTPLRLPLDRNYYLLIQPTGRVYSNKLSCNCGGFRWCFLPETPCYTVSKVGWSHWMMAGGVFGTNLSDRENWPVSGMSHGVILHGSLSCDSWSAVCGDDIDFANNDTDHAMAWAILYKTGEILTAAFINSPEVSRYTLLGMEDLDNRRQFYNARYNAMVEYIQANFPIHRSDCLKCKSPQGMRIRSQML